MVGHLERFNPAITELKRKIEQGVFGDIVAISAKRVGPHNPRIRDVGVILDLGIHDIDLMRYIYNENIKAVYATAGTTNHSKEDHAIIVLRFTNGHSGVIETNWLTPHKVRELTVVGTKAIGHVDYIKPSLTIYGNGDKTIELEKKEPLRLELEHFLSCIENNTEPMVNGEPALRALKAALSAEKSYRNGEIVKVL
jgi:UDP-N-acetylglucosamine 3-dehydrogenase